MIEIKWINDCPSKEIEELVEKECKVLLTMVNSPDEIYYHIFPLTEDIDCGPGIFIYGNDSVNTFFVEFKSTLSSNPA